MIVQIYEIQDPLEAEAMMALGVDHLGSVLLSEGEWKDPLLKEVMRLTEGTTTKNSLIPLFADRLTLFRALDHYHPHFIHFCDSLTDPAGKALDLGKRVDLQGEVKTRFPEIRIMRSIPVPRDAGAWDGFPTLSLAAALEPVSDVFLTDTWVGSEAPVAGFIGITGLEADRDLASRLVDQSAIPVILAGGLSPENVYEALVSTRPAGADSCTHTNRVDETGRPLRFRKDPRRVAAFVEETRRAQRAIIEERDRLLKQLAAAEEELRERRAALPAHSIRPHQLAAIEELEEAVAAKRRAIDRYKEFRWTSP
jgi:phosphoribosylanthranilate isomerase